MKRVSVILPALVAVGICFLVAFAGSIEPSIPAAASVDDTDQVLTAAAKVDANLEELWAANELTPAEKADDLLVFRRLTLALFGTVPSLEEIRAFSNDPGPNRIDRWTASMMDDPRFGDYFAERLARSLVGTDDGPLLLFRRDRLKDWLSEQLRADTPWPDMVREMVAAEGLWTERPGGNFLTIAYINDEGFDVNLLTARTVRAFLGQSIDCAQCHDHPFQDWKWKDFEGLAAFYGQTRLQVAGIQEKSRENGKAVEYTVYRPDDDQDEVIHPAVPFEPSWLPNSGTRRERLAEWLVHEDNRRFERAIANRIWGLMFGKPYSAPVDDVPPPDTDSTDVLDILGQSFREHRGSIQHLVRTIASTRAFQLSSQSDFVDEDTYFAHASEWAVFPLVRLRPEQVIGSMIQAAHIKAVDQNSHLFVRLQRLGIENNFLREYGDGGADELEQSTGTIPQALLRMNGNSTREMSEVNPLLAAGQIMAYSADDESLIRNAFLVCLTRKPTRAELETLNRELAAAGQPIETKKAATDVADDVEKSHKDKSRKDKSGDPARTHNPGRDEFVKDLFWALFNSPEFSWNH